MKHLSRLTPAETLMIKHGDKTPLSDLLKYTLMDLLLKQVLVITEVERQPSSRDAIRTYKYVTTGKNFVTHIGKAHEIIFISIFQKNVEISVLFRNLVKIVYQNAISARSYYALLINNANLKNVFHVSLYQNIFGGFSLTEKGIQLKKELEHEIEQLERTLPGIIAQNKKQGLEILKTIGGNVFLLTGIDSALANEIDKQLFEEMQHQKTGSGSGCSSSGCWTSFDTFSETFDSSCSSDSGSGCSGDSGCSASGCSGCGGGCGGGD